MLTVRLPNDLETEINRLASTEKKTKSDIIKEAIRQYIASHRKCNSSYELGHDLFGIESGLGAQKIDAQHQEGASEDPAQGVTHGPHPAGHGGIAGTAGGQKKLKVPDVRAGQYAEDDPGESCQKKGAEQIEMVIAFRSRLQVGGPQFPAYIQ